MTKLLSTALLLLVLFDIGSRVVYAQSNGANFIGSLSGTTVTNCGTPTTPSFCAVGTGVFIWQNATTGWFLVAPPAGGSFLSGVNVNGTAAPVSNGVASITVPTKATVNLPASTLTGTVQ